jgi:ribonuclease VapC
MILDTSAIVAILQGEPEAAEFAALIEAEPAVRISAATVLEASIVLGAKRQTLLDDFIDTARASIVPVDTAQLSLARRAHLQYGRGSGSPAKLNYGDCFAYALAIVSGRQLLFKGDDFSHTDVVPAASS